MGEHLLKSIKPLSHCSEFELRVVASYNSPQLVICRMELVQMSSHVEEMSPHVARTRREAARILNGLKLSCEFSCRAHVEEMSNKGRIDVALTRTGIVCMSPLLVASRHESNSCEKGRVYIRVKTT